jgi:DNA-binding transcriptional ArsR family regulator
LALVVATIAGLYGYRRMATHEHGRDEANDSASDCGPDEHEHEALPTPRYDNVARERAVRLFKALGDEARLRTLELLIGREVCVSELAEASAEQISTVSHRLRLLRSEGLVNRRRDGRHIYYSLADKHVFELIQNALEHAAHH